MQLVMWLPSPQEGRISPGKPLAPGPTSAHIEPGSPWENGYCAFNGKLRDECLNLEIFYSLKEARVVIEQWRNQYNTVRPHSSLGYRPPTLPQTSTGIMPTLDQPTRHTIISIRLVQNIRQVILGQEYRCYV